MGLRERKKEKTRLALLDAALDLFLEQGYDSTTIDQVAASADVSPRTFFRYFTSKDHLVLWFHDQAEETMTEALADRPCVATAIDRAATRTAPDPISSKPR